jgi:hypothetical protein
VQNTPLLFTSAKLEVGLNSSSEMLKLSGKVHNQKHNYVQPLQILMLTVMLESNIALFKGKVMAKIQLL